jgi:hypothetical protein
MTDDVQTFLNDPPEKDHNYGESRQTREFL